MTGVESRIHVGQRQGRLVARYTQGVEDARHGLSVGCTGEIGGEHQDQQFGQRRSAEAGFEFRRGGLRGVASGL